jgi:drug/metabolite transporter (DMT)-like permease
MAAHLTTPISFAAEKDRTWVRAIFFMCLSAFSFAVIELIGQHMVQGISSYEVVWSRYAVHLLFMGVALGPRYKTRLIQTSHLKLQIARALCMLGMPIFFLLGVQVMPSNDVWSVYWLAPMIGLVLSAWILGEGAGWKRWAANIVGFIGVLLILRPDRGIFSLAALLPIGMGFCFSLHLTLSRMLRIEHPLVSLFYTALGVFVPLTFVMPFLWQSPSLSSWLGIVLFGLIGTLGLYAFARSAELTPLPAVVVFAYTETLWTILLKAVLFHELPTKLMMLGGVIVAGVSVYMFLHEYHQHKAD